MSKEENRSRESCIYDDHTFEDSPPATKKAKYQPRQPGRRSTVTCITTEFLVLLGMSLGKVTEGVSGHAADFLLFSNLLLTRLQSRRARRWGTCMDLPH